MNEINLVHRSLEIINLPIYNLRSISLLKGCCWFRWLTALSTQLSQMIWLALNTVLSLTVLFFTTILISCNICNVNHDEQTFLRAAYSSLTPGSWYFSPKCIHTPAVTSRRVALHSIVLAINVALWRKSSRRCIAQWSQSSFLFFLTFGQASYGISQKTMPSFWQWMASKTTFNENFNKLCRYLNLIYITNSPFTVKVSCTVRNHVITFSHTHLLTH